MREIKFSYMYQHEETGKWIDIIYTLDDIENGDVNYYGAPYGSKLIARRQCIEIKDKKGIEIYDGDICVNESGRIAKCIYNGPSASFDFVALNAIGVQHGYLPEYKLTVIGNIYENPELLNRESDR